jgi:hypothetical protein
MLVKKENRGGARKGAGRKPGSINRLSAQLIRDAERAGVMPLQVMLANMRIAWNNGDLATAHKAAVDCAPYIHPKLTAVDAKIEQHNYDHIVDDPVQALLSRWDARRRAQHNGEGLPELIPPTTN